MSQYPAVLELSDLDGANGFRINGEARGDFGGSVASAGDVNGDGFADVIVGAFGADPNGNQSGASYVVFGHGGGFGPAVELSDLDGANGFQINGKANGDFSGESVSSAGDVNGDGFDDVIIGAKMADPHGADSGASFVVFGKASGFHATFELSGLDGDNGFQINGEAADDVSGGSVSSAGDINGDGFGDVIVGAYFADPNGDYSGASYVVFGKASGFSQVLNLSALTADKGFQINGAAPGDVSGASVSWAGDVNSDGFGDLIVGASSAAPHGDRSGTSYVIFGKASSFGTTLELSGIDGSNGFVINGEAANDYSGDSVAAAGDVNGDGIADVIVGAAASHSPDVNSGASYVVFGRASDVDPVVDVSALNGANGFKIAGEGPLDAAGCSVSAAGDFNGDGFGDLIVGAVGADPNGDYSGASYVVFGRASGFAPVFGLSGIDGNNGFQIDGASAHDSSGRHVAAAGDVNGDGLDDVLVGALSANPNGPDSGASYVVFGSLPNVAVTRTGTDIANVIHGGDFDDTLSGLSGNDKLFGHDGDDAMFAGDGNDRSDGGRGDDTMRGGSGNDTVLGGVGDDNVTGGSGNDVINGGSGVDDLWGGSGADRMSGDAGSDTMDGRSGNDTLDGDEGNDVLAGSDGADTLTGGGGDDRLAGGDGKDALNGGAGVDRFVYGTAADSTSVNYDTVANANFAADRWDVEGDIANVDATIGAGSLSTSQFDAKLAAAADSTHLRAHHAVVFTPTSGSLGGHIFLIVDQNGVAGYQAGVDLVVELKAPVNLGDIDEGDFI